jgi:hydroxyethylthiazole kinase
MTLDYAAQIAAVRAQHPLVHNITNFVVMNMTANALLAVGASPVMAHAVEEMAEMTSLASALVINIGTLSAPWIVAMKAAAAIANQRGIPYVLDPVGAGATQFRTRTARELLELGGVTILRGNASEICALANEAVQTRGVDSTLASDRAREAAHALATQYQMTVVVSGQVDYIISPERRAEVRNGHALMTQVTGMGCTSTALMGAFAAVSPDAFTAAVATMTTMGIAGELAAQPAAGPGTFVPHLLDALAALTPATLTAHSRVVLKD